MGMLPGDELVADYLARAGRASAAALAPADCVAVVEEVGRRVRAKVGPPPRWDTRGAQARLAELGAAEDLVDAVARELASRAFEVPQAAAEAEQEPPAVAPAENPTVELSVRGPVLPIQGGRVSQTAGGGPPRGPSGPLYRDEELPRVRPHAPNESVAREGLFDVNRLGWELVALVVLGVGVFPFGYLGWALGAVLITRSRYWEISDKVRVLFGMPTAALGLALLWAWLKSTQISESNNSGRRLSEAGDSLAHSLAVMPALCGLLGAIYLAYALVRDHHAG
ncbi:MAG TPA: hypothetical protein VMZ00_18330 [Sporichthya sp.]|nr:hypothetical protein [Sporichthya sp.]